jgi:diguanylate cyclase (GGDEF)-like protein
VTAIRDNNKNIEISGLLIHSFVESINRLNIIPQSFLESKLTGFDFSSWYSLSKFTEVLQSIGQVTGIANGIYFQAGTQLASIVNQQTLSDQPFSAHAWLNSNIRDNVENAEQKSNSYMLQAHDVQVGNVIYVCAIYLPLAYLMGYFYGCYHQGHFENVEVSLLEAQQTQPESFNISVRYSSSLQTNFLGVKDKLQAEYQQEISQLLQDSLANQMETSVMVSRLNAELIDQRDKIARLANHDPVTGLASLRLGRDRLRMACNTAKRNNVKAAVMLIDLDGFKQANGQYGHVVGDAILKTVAERITKSIRATDSAVRQSGDSFLIILSMFNEAQALAIVAKRVISAISEPIAYETLTLNIACNIGIAIYPDDTNAAEQMIKCADKAIHTIKKPLKNEFSFYENAN